jgi:hypothetical protein
MKKKEEKIGDALMKVALGCRVEEVTEEYSEVEGELRLTKRRKTKKDIPPDLKAVQILLGADVGSVGGVGVDGGKIAMLSDEALEEEKRRLLENLWREEEGNATIKKSECKSAKKEKDEGRDLTNEKIEAKSEPPKPLKRKRSVVKKAAEERKN